MKFAHIADCHLGGWREAKLRELGELSFITAIDKCISEKVDFVLIAGDLFNTSLPPIETISLATKKLKELKDLEIAVYIIAGSHDFSPSGKTMLEVLEHAGLVINVSKGEINECGKLALKFTVDNKTGAKITGLLGKKGGLDRDYYHSLEYSHLISEMGYKIFMFHCAINELKPKELEKMDSMPVSLMPQGFNYYAGGHVHIIENLKLDKYENVVYPGPTFPNNFSELSKLGKGNFVIVEDGLVRNVPLELKKIINLKIDAKSKSPMQIEEELKEKINSQISDVKDSIITIKIKGTLSEGKPSEIDFKHIIDDLYISGAYLVMKNTNSLMSKEFEEIKVTSDSVENIEEELIEEHLSQSNSKLDLELQKKLAKQLFATLSLEKQEGETVYNFETRLKKELDLILFEKEKLKINESV